MVALVPQWRRQAPTPDRPISDHQLLEILKEQETLSFTPSRRIGNRNISCYDDRYSRRSMLVNSLASLLPADNV